MEGQPGSKEGLDNSFKLNGLKILYWALSSLFGG